MFVRDGDDWIGFAFDVPTAKLTEGSRVTSVEVSHGARPAACTRTGAEAAQAPR